MTLLLFGVLGCEQEELAKESSLLEEGTDEQAS